MAQRTCTHTAVTAAFLGLLSFVFILGKTYVNYGRGGAIDAVATGNTGSLHPSLNQSDEGKSTLLTRKHHGRDGSKKYGLKKVLIYAKYRTGSTFMSEFLNRSRVFFYSFEVLQMTNASDRNSMAARNGWIRKALDCQFQDLWHAGIHNPIHEASSLAGWKTKIFCYKLGLPANCSNYSMSEIEEICKTYPYQVTKEILIPSLSSLRPLLDEGIRVLHVVRDVRGVLASRLRVSSQAFLVGDNLRHRQLYNLCIEEARRYCQSLKADLTYILTEGKIHPHIQYTFVRYEDFALEPRENMEMMFASIGIEPDDDIRLWASQLVHSGSSHHRHVIHEDAFLTERANPSDVVTRWKRYLSFSLVQDIQSVCWDLLVTLNYTLVTSKQDMRTPTVLKPFHFRNLSLATLMSHLSNSTDVPGRDFYMEDSIIQTGRSED